MRTLNETKQVTKTEGDHTESLKTLDEQAIEDPTLVAGVEDKLSRLSNLNELTKDDNFNRLPKEKTATLDEEDDGSTSEVKDDSDVQDDDQTESQTVSDNLTPEVEKKSEIPESYIRAAAHHGLDKGAVDDMVKSNPESAMKLLESCYLSVNNASREWSELGRAKIETERQQAAVKTTTETVAEENPKTVALIAKLRKEYVDDPLIEVVIKDLEAKPKPVQQSVPQAQQGYETATARYNAATNAAIDQRINTFFDADDMELYNKFYGKLELGQIPEDLTNGQQHNRLAVLQEAEFIMTGHAMRNQKIEVEQALEKAHLIVTEPIRTQVVRDSLKTTAVKRKKSMTLKPSESKRTSDSMKTDSSKPRNRRELELAVRQKLDSVFKK
ncbi:hypothetical protein KA005_72000 [bacterium]|nr:hypothetical protein [bacterium]